MSNLYCTVVSWNSHIKYIYTAKGYSVSPPTGIHYANNETYLIDADHYCENFISQEGIYLTIDDAWITRIYDQYLTYGHLKPLMTSYCPRTCRYVGQCSWHENL